MKALEIKPGVFWVGGIDWNLREFHGYKTPRGSTYNAYLIVDERIALVDTVKHYLADELLERVAQVIDPARIDYVVVNHVEMDHSGSLPRVMEVLRNARIITSAKGKEGLERHYEKKWECDLVRTGDQLPLGRRTLSFIQMPMVHWPESMASYIPEEKLLLPNDAFGQHIASSERFDDELGLDVVLEEAAKYYANIVFPYGDQVNKCLDAVEKLDVDMIAPSHGVIWRTHIKEIQAAYRRWANNETELQAVIVYDTMWGSTAKLAQSLKSGLEDAGVNVTMRCLQTNHISGIVPDILKSRMILIGTPTLNNGMLPTVGAFLTYVKGLRPKNRIGFAFGSYGWGGQGARLVGEIIKEMGWEMPEEPMNIKYVPTEEELMKAKETGARLASLLQRNS